jgi:hypothetical protein
MMSYINQNIRSLKLQQVADKPKEGIAFFPIQQHGHLNQNYIGMTHPFSSPLAKN